MRSIRSLAMLTVLHLIVASGARAQSAPREAAPVAPAAPTIVQPAPPYAQPAPPYAQPAPVYAQGYAQPAPAYYPTRRGRPIVGYRAERRNPPAIWGTGLGLFLAGWVLDFAVLTPIANAISTDRPGANEQDAWAWSLVPIVGPLVQLAIEAPHPAIPLITGLLQVGGLVTFIVGLTTQETHQAAIYQGDPEDPAMLRVELDAAPTAGGAMLGLTVRHL